MKHLFQTIAFGIGLLFSGFAMEARAELPSAISPSPDGPAKSIPIPKGMEKKMRNRASHGPLRTLERNASPKASRRNVGEKPRRANSAATEINGNCIYRAGAGDFGWYKVQWPSDRLVWKRPSQYNPMCGFVRGDEIFNFYSLSNGQGIIDAGIAIQDLATGVVKQYYQIDIFDSLEQVAYAVGYDEATDMAWLATYNKQGSGMILQKFDPKTLTFTKQDVSIPMDIMDMGWNPADQSLYILSEYGVLSRYDSKAKKFNQVVEYNYDFTGYPNDIVYSPKDKCFFALVDSYDSQDNPCTDALLLKTDGGITYLGTIADNPQYSMLYIADKYVNMDAPKAPAFKSWNVSGQALSGTLNLTLPSKYENGSQLSGNVYLQIETSGATVSGTFKGTPGADVAIPVDAEEGLASLVITPYILTDDGKLFGTPLLVSRYFGVDTPAAPTNVRLTSDKVSWDAVVAGANNGYIDASSVRYNVWIDGTAMNATPINATSLDVTIPQNGKAAHVAEVRAIAGNKTSEPGISGKYYTDGALSVPLDLSPEQGEADLDPAIRDMFTCVKDIMNTEELRGWRYDDQSEHTGGFYSLVPRASSLGDKANEFLFLPPIDFEDASSHYRLAMDVWTGGHYFSETEYYEVVISRQPNGRDYRVIRPEEGLTKKSYFETSETLFEVDEPGIWYIGIRHCSPFGTYRIYARNFKVEKVATTSSSPAAVENLQAAAAERGELKANLTFKFPTKTISGDRLDGTAELTVTAVSSAGEVSTTGLPGTTGSIEIPTVQGENLIQVTPSSAQGPGPVAEVMVYTGVYRPSSPIVQKSVSDDNQTLTLNISIDDYNDLGEFAGPDQCDLTIYRKVNDEWRVAEEIGKNRTWTFQCPEPATQDLYAIGVAAKNAVGYCEKMTTFGVHLGKLYTLPLTETFQDRNGQLAINNEPITIDHISYLPAEWGFCNPADADPLAANASNTALYATWEAESQILLPRFSTLGAHNAKLDLSLFFGDKTPELTTVLAASPAMDELTEIASFGKKDGKGWEHKLITLPAECQNKGWVQLAIRVDLHGYSQYFLMESYAVADYPSQMITITGMSAPSKAAVGDMLNYKIEIENAGTESAPMAAYDFSLTTPAGVRQAELLSAPTSIAPSEKGEISFAYRLTKADMGKVDARFELKGQPSAAVSSASAYTTVLNAPVPKVNDLAASVEGSRVALEWSLPLHVESFEAFEPWDYSPILRNFSNIDEDGGETWAITELTHPGKFFAKAFQVYDGSIVENPLLQAHSGIQYLGCMSSKNGVSSDWLISSEIEPGSKVAFYANLLSADYPEAIRIEYSETSNDPSDFLPLEGGSIDLNQTGWTRHEFLMPASAVYFAIHHVGNNGQNQFGLLIDDIEYSPVDAIRVDGYNVYRDGEFLANVAAPGYVDETVDLSMPVMYAVKAVGTLNGEQVESERSNVVWTEESGIAFATQANRAIFASGNEAAFRGFAINEAYLISDASGRKVAAGRILSNLESVKLAPGIYIAECGDTTVKIIIK